MTDYPTFIEEEIEPIRYTTTENVMLTRFVKKDGQTVQVCPILHGPDKEFNHPYYKWFLHTKKQDWRPQHITHDINPDIQCTRALYDSGCDDAGFDQHDEFTDDDQTVSQRAYYTYANYKDKEMTLRILPNWHNKPMITMHNRTIQDCCKKVTDHNGRNVIAAIQEKKEEKVTWQYDPATWIEVLRENTPIDLIVNFCTALRKLGWGRTETLRLMHGQKCVITSWKDTSRVDKAGIERKFSAPCKARKIAGLTHPDMPLDILMERMNQIIEMSRIEDLSDLYEQERRDAEQSNMEYYHASDEVAYYDKDGIFKEVSYVQKNIEWDITAPLQEDENGDEIIQDYTVILEDGTDQTNDAVTHTLRPFPHPNDSLPYHEIERILEMDALDLTEFQKTMFDPFNYKYTPKQKSAVWTWIDHRRNQLGMAPTKGFMKYYRVKNYKWQLKPDYTYLKQCLKARALKNKKLLQKAA